MKPKHIIPAFAVFCIAVHAAETADLVTITDPSKILESKAYDLGDRNLTVQEISKDALPMPPAPIPPVIQLEPTPDFTAKHHRKLGFSQLGGSIYLRRGQPARTLLDYRPQGSDPSGGEITFQWSVLNTSSSTPVVITNATSLNTTISYSFGSTTDRLLVVRRSSDPTISAFDVRIQPN